MEENSETAQEVPKNEEENQNKIEENEKNENETPTEAKDSVENNDEKSGDTATENKSEVSEKKGLEEMESPAEPERTADKKKEKEKEDIDLFADDNVEGSLDLVPQKARKPARRKKEKGGVMGDTSGDLFNDKDVSPGELDLLPEQAKKTKKGRKSGLSLLDDLPDDDDGDLFSYTKKNKKKSIDLLSEEAPAERKPRKRSGKRALDMLSELMAEDGGGSKVAPERPAQRPVQRAVQEVEMPKRHERVYGMPKPGEYDVFGFRDEKMKFADANEFREEVMKRFERFEKLIEELSFTESGTRDLSSSIPDDVLRESVERIVSSLHQKDEELREKEILIDFLQEAVDSTFERDEIIKEQAKKRGEIEEEEKETEAAGNVCDELQNEIDQLEQQLKDVAVELQQREKETKEAHEQDQYKMAMLTYEEQEPLEERLKTAKNDQVKYQIELSRLVADNTQKKAGIDVESFEEIQRLKAQVPNMLSKAVIQMRDGVEDLLSNAFNPLKEYPGDKIHLAMRNALQRVGKQVLSQ